MFTRAALLLAVTGILYAQTDVLTNRYDQFSQGANTHEQQLNAKNVNQKGFGKLYSYYVDGAVYAQPLYVHHVLYVATMNDKVYAFDATKAGPPLWMRDLTDERSGVTPVPVSDITNNNDLNLVGNAGIEGTPVIDLASQSLFLVARTKENGRYLQRLHKLDLHNGSDQIPAAVIEARVQGSAADARDGFVSFDPRAGNQRPALALVNGAVVVAWASHEDLGQYHGWIMAYDAATLKQDGALCVTPDTSDGGVWQSGRGPAVDQSGALYFETGNGDWDGKRNFGDSVIKIRAGKSGVVVEDFYTPHDYVNQNEKDADYGSTGPLLIPEKGILVTGNKYGQFILLSTNNLGGMTPGDTGIKQVVEAKSGRILAGPSFWNGPLGPVLFIWNEAGVPKMFRFKDRVLDPTPAAEGTVGAHGSPGGSLTVSSDGAKAGTGVLWATVSLKSADHGNAAGALYAFNAETLAELWDSEANVKRDHFGTLVKFVPPLVVDGRVYVPNYDNAVNVYGLLDANQNL